MENSERHGRVDPQRPARFGGQHRNGRLGLLQFGQDALRPFEEGGPDFGKAEAACGAVEQPRSETFLQGRDLLARSRFGNAEIAGCRREVAGLGDPDKDGQTGVRFHGLSQLFL